MAEIRTRFRALTGKEVDIFLEESADRLVGIEFKVGATVTSHDFKGLRPLPDLMGRRFQRGVVLFTGTESVAFGPRLHALPVSALWSMGARKK